MIYRKKKVLKYFKLLNSSTEIPDHNGKFLFINIIDHDDPEVRQNKKLIERCELHGLIKQEIDFPCQETMLAIGDLNPNDDKAIMTVFKMTLKGKRYLQNQEKFIQRFRRSEWEQFWENLKRKFEKIWIGVATAGVIGIPSFIGGMYFNSDQHQDAKPVIEQPVETFPLPDRQISEVLPICYDAETLDNLLEQNGYETVSIGNSDVSVHMRPDGYIVAVKDSCVVSRGWF